MEVVFPEPGRNVVVVQVVLHDEGEEPLPPLTVAGVAGDNADVLQALACRPSIFFYYHIKKCTIKKIHHKCKDHIYVYVHSFFGEDF